MVRFRKERSGQGDFEGAVRRGGRSQWIRAFPVCTVQRAIVVVRTTGGAAVIRLFFVRVRKLRQAFAWVGCVQYQVLYPVGAAKLSWSGRRDDANANGGCSGEMMAVERYASGIVT